MTGKTVLVTGATSGIGKATAIGLAGLGADLAITGRDPERTEAAAREIRAAGSGLVEVFVADLSSQSEVRRLASEVLQRLPRIDVLVNNVGDSGARAYNQSKLANVLFTYELARRLRASSVTANALHPGVVFASCTPKKSSKRSYDEAVAARLWEVSADFVGLTDPQRVAANGGRLLRPRRG